MNGKKFRFDSFASEFASLEEAPSTQRGNGTGTGSPAETLSDQDSGIGSDENQTSPLPLRLHQVRDQPLSLVQHQNVNDSDESHVVKRHWKKSLKDQADVLQEPPVKKMRHIENVPVQEEAENLCLHDLRRQSAESSVAQALLSLGMVNQKTNFSPQQHNILREKPVGSFQNNVIMLPQHPIAFPNYMFPSVKPSFPHTPLREIQAHSSSDNQRSLSKSFFSPGRENEAPSAFLKQGKKPFYCTVCKKGFSTQSGYIKHDELHKSNQIQRDFSCRFCNKRYTSLSALKMHTRTHTLPCKCNICGKSFSRPWLLQGHVRTHTGEKPFSCNYCLRSFADKSNLRAHLQTHLQTKKYSCQTCHKTFSRMSLLNKHTESNCKNNINENFQPLSLSLIRN